MLGEESRGGEGCNLQARRVGQPPEQELTQHCPLSVLLPQHFVHQCLSSSSSFAAASHHDIHTLLQVWHTAYPHAA